MGTHGTAHALNQSLYEDLREDWTCSAELSSLDKVIIIIIMIIIFIIFINILLSYLNGVSVCIYMLCMLSVSATSKVFNYFK